MPTALVYDAFAAKVTGVKMSDYVQSVDVATDAALQTADLLPGMDAIQFPTTTPAVLGLLWLSRVDLPGVELPDDSLWQMHEEGLMTVDDYDRIVEMGYGPWVGSFIGQHLSHLVPGAMALGAGTPRAIGEFLSRGIVVFSPAATTIPYEHLLRRSLDEGVHPRPAPRARQGRGGHASLSAGAQAHRARDGHDAAPHGDVGGRLALGQRVPLAQALGPFRLAVRGRDGPRRRRRGGHPVLHFDANWDRDLERFKELPAATCVLALDSMTDIFKAKEILGDHMCLLGDVPPRMLTLGTP